jgi:hypothetical protein
LDSSRCARLFGFLLLSAAVLPLAAQKRVERPAQISIVEVKEPDGQILSYRYLSGSTDVRMKGTRRAPGAQARLKIGSRPGFVEIDFNRGAISGLQPARRFGKDFLTYVLWAVSVDGRAANLGEITFDGQNPVSINVTTPYQTFWLMVTAEPDYAVADPSPLVILYSVSQSAADAPPDKRALTIRKPLFYYTHYMVYDSSPAPPEPGPNELLQARKAVELASKSGILAPQNRPRTATPEEEQTRDALELARGFLAQAESAYQKNPKGSEVVQFARTAAQIAENARALALGAVGGVLVRRLENELSALQIELERLRSVTPKPPVESAKGPVPPQKTPSEPAPIVETEATSIGDKVAALASQPIAWFGLIGWIVVVLLLFRRRSV